MQPKMVFVLFALAPCCWLNIVCRQFLSPLPSHVLPFQYFDISFFFLSWRTLYLSIKICFLFLAFFYANLFLVLSSRIEFPNVSNFADQRGGEGRREQMVPRELSASTHTCSSICPSGVHTRLPLTQMECTCMCSTTACANEDACARTGWPFLQPGCNPFMAH